MINKTLIVLASYSAPSQLEKDISGQTDTLFLKWNNVPKALLPLSKKTSLSWFLEYCNSYFSNVYIIANAYNYNYYERWSSEYEFPKSNIANCGLSSGALEDLAFLNRIKLCSEDTVVVLPDLLLNKEDVPIFIDGINQRSNQIIYGTTEKKGHPLPIAFCISLNHIQSLEHVIESFSSSLVQEDKLKICSMDMINQLTNFIQSKDNNDLSLTIQLSSSFYEYSNHQLTLSDYIYNWMALFDQQQTLPSSLPLPEIIRKKAYARVGLMGNPSDGFYGKTMSLLISNFWAQVTLIPNHHNYISSSNNNSNNNKTADVPMNELFKQQLNHSSLSTIQIITNPMADMQQFNNIESLIKVCDQNGYNNADRLFLACIKVFYQYCQQNGIPLDTSIGFQILFETNIPRQVGLAGSSAIITAFWKCLLTFYQLSNHHHDKSTTFLTLERQASLILSVEVDELGIAAGLQDRVIQTYGGLVFMDFEKSFMDKHGYGQYTILDHQLLPTFYLAYIAHPEDSGKVHSTVKQRFLNGDIEIIEAMKQFAQLTEKSVQALKEKDYKLFGSLMTQNFELRRKTYGDQVVGKNNLRMVDIVRKHGGNAKFSGSGGAIIILLNDFTSTQIQHLAWDLEKEGFVFVKLIPKGKEIDQ
ncbi:unnamed protein product [Cunninghamella blakesleeana]